MSSKDRFDEIARLFEAACELPAAERRAFLERECAGDRELLDEVLELLREDQDPGGPLPQTPPSPEAPAERTPSSEFLRQLSAHQPKTSRYRLVGELARGGMGAVLKVWDEDLGRPLAMKVVLGQTPEKSGETPRVSERVLARFLEEAQITGQLDHPGIVPVHELGLDERGRVFFTMRLVRGLTLKQVFSLHKKNQQGWSRARALEVLLKVCDTMAFAHEKGVIHRDIKPSNVMVGRFGEVYVVDWGLARSETAESTPPAELAGPPEAQGSAPVHVRVRRGSDPAALPTSPAYTRQGDVVGTPFYMPPEQARGDLAALGPWSDIYSVGAMLYQLVAGEPPYAAVDHAGAVEVLAALKAGPPASLARAKSAPPELVAICERAMARVPAERYADMRAMASDLRAFLDQRVVQAYRTGALVEFRKWVARNRAVAASAALAVVVAGVAAVWIAAAEHRRAAVLFDEYQRTLAARLIQELERGWIVRGESAAAMRRWIADAEGLLASHERELERAEQAVLAATATPNDRMRGFESFIVEAQEFSRGDEQKLASGELDADERRRLEANVATLAAELPEFERRIEREALEVALALLAELEGNLLRLERALPAVRDRNAQAESLARRTVEERSQDWGKCAASVRDPAVCPLYEGLGLEPLTGLIPLRRNPATGLWEFWLWLSGDEPTLGDDGDWRIGPSTGMVMILVPGARDFHLGAQADDPSLPNYDLQATFQEGPVKTLDLAPFFLSRYEMTQGQWFRLTGEWPSERFPGIGYANTTRFTRTHPVEQVSFLVAERELAPWGLALPTEAQWERAARAGTDLPYGHSADPAAMEGRDNLKDLSLTLFGNQEGEVETWNDGYPAHAPVDAFPPNAFGFHGMHGNLAEWTRDWHCEEYGEKYLMEIAPRTGELSPRFAYTRTVRGGHYYVEASRARVTRRTPMLPTDQSNTVGLRPAITFVLETTPETKEGRNFDDPR